MKIKQITENTTSGSIATVDTALGGTQSRGNPSIYGGKKVGSLFKGKKTKAPYANSINESAELSEAQLEEDDVIVVPGQGRGRKNGFIPHGKSRVDHEVEMARSDLFSAAKNAQQVYSMIKDLSEEEGLDGWVQEKIIKANDYLNTIREYLEGKQVQGVTEGTDDVDSLVTDTETVMKKFKIDALPALKIVLGEREYKDRPGYYNLFIRQIIARSKQQGMAEGVGSAINVSEALQAMKQLANTTNRHISTKTYNGLLDWGDGNLAEIVVNAIKACTTLSNYYKNNNQLDYAQLINKLQSELIAFKNGDAFVTIKQLSQGTLSKINFQQGVAEGLGKDIKRLATGKDVKSRAGQEIAKSQDASMKGDTKTSKKHFDRYDKLDKLANKEKGVAEGAKVDRMVKHVAQSEKKLGKSKKEAENIAWATANKRGMLDNKNKKA